MSDSLTVADLIAELEKIEDKTLVVYVYSYDDVSKPTDVKQTDKDDIDCHGGVLII